MMRDRRSGTGRLNEKRWRRSEVKTTVGRVPFSEKTALRDYKILSDLCDAKDAEIERLKARKDRKSVV